MVSFLSKSIFQNEITDHKSKIQKKKFYISDLHFYFHFKEKVHEFECLENDVDRRVIGKKVNSSVSWKMYPPASEASREKANLTERKNPHTPEYGVKDFVCLWYFRPFYSARPW